MLCHPVYKRASLAAQPHTHAQSVGRGASLMALVRGPSLTPLFSVDMGHTRRPKRMAEKLLQIRESLGLSQREIAERLGIYRTHHHISKYERDKSIPFMEVLLAYARIGNVQM